VHRPEAAKHGWQNPKVFRDVAPVDVTQVAGGVAGCHESDLLFCQGGHFSNGKNNISQ